MRNFCIWWGDWWQGLEYVRGQQTSLVLNSDQLTLDFILGHVHSLVCADLNHFKYVIHTLVDIGGCITKHKVKDDMDIRGLYQQVDEPMLFVTVKAIPQ